MLLWLGRCPGYQLPGLSEAEAPLVVEDEPRLGIEGFRVHEGLGFRAFRVAGLYGLPGFGGAQETTEF